MIKKYWDILGGIITAVIFSILAKFDIDRIQLFYSIIILTLVSIGVWRIIKQAIDKNKTTKVKKRAHTIIDDIVDAQTPIKSINLAQNPTREGEKLGNLILETIKRGKKKMKKLKVLFDKFKGYMLTIALGILTVAEMCGGFINSLFAEKFTVNGVNIISVVVLAAAIVVGIISNGYTKEDRERIKALFTKKPTNELVAAQIKKTLKEDELKLKEYNKTLAVKETELENLNSQYLTAKNTHEAKQEMYRMIPQLATSEEVQEAANDVVNIEAKINDKQEEINKLHLQISTITTKINALKIQL